MLHYSELKDKLPKLAKFGATHYSVDCSGITIHHLLHHYTACIMMLFINYAHMYKSEKNTKSFVFFVFIISTTSHANIWMRCICQVECMIIGDKYSKNKHRSKKSCPIEVL